MSTGGSPGSQFVYEDAQAFEPARSRKKRKNRTRVPPLSSKELLDRSMSELMSAADWIRVSTSIVRDCLTSLSKKPSETICLGLGSPCTSRQARVQLCFLAQLRDGLEIDPQNVSAFDPIFTDEDNELLLLSRVRPLSENKAARYRLDSPTILFMPHCTTSLYENLLRANWAKERLENLVLIGNDLRATTLGIPSRRLHTDYPCLARLTPYLVIVHLPEYTPHPATFIGTAVHIITSKSLPPLEHDFWELPGEIQGCSEAAELK